MTPVTDDVDLSGLPEQTKEFIKVIGLADTMRLTNIFGGLYVTFSDRCGASAVGSRSDVVEAILGPERAAKFFKAFGGKPFYWPRCTQQLNDARHREIRTDAGKMSMPELVLKHELSVRQIRRILKAQ